MKESQRLISETRKKVKKILQGTDPRAAAQESLIKDKIRDDVGSYLFQKTERRPMILPVIIEV